MIAYMEAKLTEALKIKSKNDNSTVTEEPNFDEVINAEAKAIKK